eukprot:SRR837773.15333.p1 GENE.SRR837773.15333~~SRR837773.15333.p1  ORF type:complete len:600 (-),score=171.27 SRR837773.15333:61-1632(-)
MVYTSPAGGDLRHPQVISVIEADGNVSIFDTPKSKPWLPRQERQPLVEGEFTVRFFCHATIEMRIPGLRVVTDPWCAGPAYLRGWWLQHRPPADWLDAVTSADWIFLSHAHEDHANPYSLSLLYRKNPRCRFLIARQPKFPLKNMIMAAGFAQSTITEINGEEWFDLGAGCRGMILWDLADPDGLDTSLLLEYKGHSLLNLVDCINPNLLNLPGPVDVLCSAFAGGASSFPSCWVEVLGEDKCDEYSDNKNKKLIAQIEKWIVQTQPRLYFPFAGYFVEADPDVKRLNKKNTAQGVVDTLKPRIERKANCKFWVPKPEEVLDVSTLSVAPGRQSKKLLPPLHETMRETDELLAQELDFPPLQTMRGVEMYFKWALNGKHAYVDDLIVHIVETDRSYNHVIREYYLNFQTGTVTSGKPPKLGADGSLRYLRLKVYAGVMRRMMRTCEQWDYLNVGLQFRGYREPNYFNQKFWWHFGYHLPQKRLDWGDFNSWEPTPRPRCDAWLATAVFCTAAVVAVAVLVKRK